MLSEGSGQLDQGLKPAANKKEEGLSEGIAPALVPAGSSSLPYNDFLSLEVNRSLFMRHPP